MIKVGVDLYKDSGKWKYSGIVEIPDRKFINSSLYDDIIKHQDFLIPGAIEYYYMVVSNVDENGVFPRLYVQANKSIGGIACGTTFLKLCQ